MYWYAKESIENVATNAWCVDISPFKNGYDTVLVAVPITTVIVSLNSNTALLETRTCTRLL